MLGRRPRVVAAGGTREAGISLIEVAVSLVLVAVGLLGLASVFPISRLAIIQGDQMSTAVRLAQQRLEDMRNVTYNETTDSITTANFPSQAYGTIVDFSGYRRQVTITNNAPVNACTPPPGTPCTKTVRVETFFRDERGQEQSTALQLVFVR